MRDSFRFVFSFAWVFVVALLMGEGSFAFPDTVRHGYVHCSACHMSLNGGDVLSPYGRALSRELISQATFGGKPAAEGEEAVIGGAVPTPEWLTMGGGARVLQSFVESSRASKARFMIMQIDVDLLAQVAKRFRAFLSVGRVEPRVEQPTARDFVGISRYGVEYLLSSPEAASRMTLRAGRFIPAYGINFAEHAFVTRRYLDLQPGQERTAGEFTWSNDQYSVIATAMMSRANGNKNLQERGGIVQLATGVGEKSKVGVNYYQVERNEPRASYIRRIYGAFAHIGFSKDWYGLLEVDRPQNADAKRGFVEIFKLGYEIHQGLHLVGVQEFANLDTAKTDPKFEAYSLGVEWFPRPHWDLYALYRRERDTAVLNDFQNAVWLIGHYYF